MDIISGKVFRVTVQPNSSNHGVGTLLFMEGEDDGLYKYNYLTPAGKTGKGCIRQSHLESRCEDVTNVMKKSTNSVGKVFCVVNNKLTHSIPLGTELTLGNPMADGWIGYTYSSGGVTYDGMCTDRLLDVCCVEVTEHKESDLDKVFALVSQQGTVRMSDLFKLFPERLPKGSYQVTGAIRWLQDTTYSSSLYSFKALATAEKFTITGWSTCAGGFTTDIMFTDNETGEESYACITPESLSRYCKPLEND